MLRAKPAVLKGGEGGGSDTLGGGIPECKVFPGIWVHSHLPVVGFVVRSRHVVSWSYHLHYVLQSLE